MCKGMKFLSTHEIVKISAFFAFRFCRPAASLFSSSFHRMVLYTEVYRHLEMHYQLNLHMAWGYSRVIWTLFVALVMIQARE